MFSPDMLVHHMDTSFVAADEIIQNVTGKLEGGKGQTHREILDQAIQKRKQVGFNVGRLTVIGQKS